MFAIGDSAAHHEKPLGMLAQVANQQGSYLAKCLNTKNEKSLFEYKFLGAMASLGTFKGVADLGPMVPGSAGKLKGLIAFIAWRSAYWSKSVSITNKLSLIHISEPTRRYAIGGGGGGG